MYAKQMAGRPGHPEVELAGSYDRKVVGLQQLQKTYVSRRQQNVMHGHIDSQNALLY